MPLPGTILEITETVAKCIAAVIGTAFIAGFFACLFVTVVRR